MSLILTTVNVPILSCSIPAKRRLSKQIGENNTEGYTSTAHNKSCWASIPKAYCVAAGIKTLILRDYMAFMHAVPWHLDTNNMYDTVVHALCYQNIWFAIMWRWLVKTWSIQHEQKFKQVINCQMKELTEPGPMYNHKLMRQRQKQSLIPSDQKQIIPLCF